MIILNYRKCVRLPFKINASNFYTILIYVDRFVLTYINTTF